ncbi:hypothetical protein [Paenibacillus lemnae]|uniref:Uncharacterized protein n=1 Tax=Paenibacillus lemnae TaxID=1330551 RepID=A0A848M6D0_PAELE|nr:hypothetical protein [Paenibacillus lemnae]NMO95154.1 hypothetical protein [Paenibacillus lemnae]
MNMHSILKHKYELRIPLLLFTLGFAISASRSLGLMFQDQGVQAFSYPLVVLLSVLAFHKT